MQVRCRLSTLMGREKYQIQDVHEKTGLNVFADDTGLEVSSLGGAPGVYSARYAGESKSFDDNIEKLLREMMDLSDETIRIGCPDSCSCASKKGKNECGCCGNDAKNK